MAANITYTEGQIVTVTGTFTTTATGALVDPTAVTFEYAVAPPAAAAGTTITVTYTTASVPSPGIIARTSVGVYVMEIDTTGTPGYYVCEYKSTGIGQTVSNPPVTFVVQPAAL